jgi:hypothetical protein
MQLLPFIVWSVVSGGALWVVSSNVKSLSESAKTASESASSLFKEVVIPGVLIYGAYIYLKSQKKI